MTQVTQEIDPHAVEPVDMPARPSNAQTLAERPVKTGQPTAFEKSVEAKLDEIQLLAAELIEADQYDADQPAMNVPAGFMLSIVVPVYNEQDSVLEMIARLTALPLPTEIIVVDDGSTDSTLERLMEVSEIPNLRIVMQATNQGKGAALRAGFQRATGDVVIIQDADREYDPRDIPSLIAPIVAGEADVVYGSRFLSRRGAGSSFIHRLGNGLLTMASNLMTGYRLTDMETCYKAFRREIIADIPLQQDRFGFEPEITAKIARRKCRIKELPIRYNARDWSEGKKIGFRDAISALVCIVRYAITD